MVQPHGTKLFLLEPHSKVYTYTGCVESNSRTFWKKFIFCTLGFWVGTYNRVTSLKIGGCAK